jgi:hypothetical protein
MAHSEIHPDGSKLMQFAVGKDLDKWFGERATNAFARGAIEVHQKVVQGNEPCPCGSGIRFDLCCAEKAERLV